MGFLIKIDLNVILIQFYDPSKMFKNSIDVVQGPKGRQFFKITLFKDYLSKKHNQKIFFKTGAVRQDFGTKLVVEDD